MEINAETLTYSFDRLEDLGELYAEHAVRLSNVIRNIMGDPLKTKQYRNLVDDRFNRLPKETRSAIAELVEQPSEPQPERPAVCNIDDEECEACQ